MGRVALVHLRPRLRQRPGPRTGRSRGHHPGQHVPRDRQGIRCCRVLARRPDEDRSSCRRGRDCPGDGAVRSDRRLDLQRDARCLRNVAGCGFDGGRDDHHLERPQIECRGRDPHRRDRRRCNGDRSTVRRRTAKGHPGRRRHLRIGHHRHTRSDAVRVRKHRRPPQCADRQDLPRRLAQGMVRHELQRQGIATRTEAPRYPRVFVCGAARSGRRQRSREQARRRESSQIRRRDHRQTRRIEPLVRPVPGQGLRTHRHRVHGDDQTRHALHPLDRRIHPQTHCATVYSTRNSLRTDLGSDRRRTRRHPLSRVPHDRHRLHVGRGRRGHHRAVSDGAGQAVRHRQRSRRRHVAAVVHGHLDGGVLVHHAAVQTDDSDLHPEPSRRTQSQSSSRSDVDEAKVLQGRQRRRGRSRGVDGRGGCRGASEGDQTRW